MSFKLINVLNFTVTLALSFDWNILLMTAFDGEGKKLANEDIGKN